MSLFRGKKSKFPSIPFKKKNQLKQLVDESDLPLKLPPKQDLGRVYTVKNSQKISLFVALALAATTPVIATWLQKNKLETQSSASGARLPQVEELVLVDADTNEDFMILNHPATSVNLSEIPNNINIRAQVNKKVNSVDFFVDDTKITTEEKAPFSLAGDVNGDYNIWNPTSGTATIKAIPYSAANAKGQAGAAYSVSLTFLDDDMESSSSSESQTINIVPGDCNGDATVDVRDYSSLKLEMSDGDSEDSQLAIGSGYPGYEGCDSNQDGLVNQYDAVCLQQMLLGQECE